MSTRRIKFLTNVNAGRGTNNSPLIYTKGEDIELDFLLASDYIRYGWAEDFYSKIKHNPIMHVTVYPDDQFFNLGADV